MLRWSLLILLLIGVQVNVLLYGWFYQVLDGLGWSLPDREGR